MSRSPAAVQEHVVAAIDEMVHPQPYTLNPTHSTLHPRPHTLNPTPSALLPTPARKVDIRLPGTGNSNSQGARPVN